MNFWVILGFGFLGTLFGVVTGLLFGTNRKMLGGIMFAAGSVVGWSLIGVNAAVLIKAIMTHTFVWHHAVPLNALAFKIADGASTAASLSTTIIYRRMASGKGFPMNRWFVCVLLVLAGMLTLVETIIGNLPLALGLLLILACAVGALFTPSKRDRLRIACWMIRRAREQQRFDREFPGLRLPQLGPWF